MLRFLADESAKHAIIRGLCLAHPTIDLVRVQDVELEGTPDPELLEWAAEQNRLVLTHDVSTMTAFAEARIARNMRMPGLIQISQGISVGQAIEELSLLLEASRPGEWEQRVIYLPLS